jgi:hypothetical protein
MASVLETMNAAVVWCGFWRKRLSIPSCPYICQPNYIAQIVERWAKLIVEIHQSSVVEKQVSDSIGEIKSTDITPDAKPVAHDTQGPDQTSPLSVVVPEPPLNPGVFTIKIIDQGSQNEQLL